MGACLTDKSEFVRIRWFLHEGAHTGAPLRTDTNSPINRNLGKFDVLEGEKSGLFYGKVLFFRDFIALNW